MPAAIEIVPPLGYRSSLDGVRAFAVLIVAGVHTHPRLVPAGSIGVDIFFVLSGFLITTLLVEEVDGSGRISIGRFYVRRGLRLLPALFGVLVTVAAWALLVASPETRHNALREIVAAGSYTRNLTWWAEVPGTLLGHTWSLALEEQFYLVWPAVLALCLRRRQSTRGLTSVFLVVVAIVAVLRLSLVVGPAGLFIGRPDALVLGAALALLRRDHWGRWAGPAAIQWARPATIVGTAALIVIAAWDSADQPFGIGYTLAAISAAVLIFGLVVLDGRGPSRLFAWRPAVALGRISYGFYLWHLPVLRWVDDRLVGDPAVIRIPLGGLLVLLVSLLSYHLLERPALRLKQRFAPPLAATAEPGGPALDQSRSVSVTKELHG